MPEHVLLIEDDEHLSSMLSEYLGTRGFTVTARATATDGLKLLRCGQLRCPGARYHAAGPGWL